MVSCFLTFMVDGEIRCTGSCAMYAGDSFCLNYITCCAVSVSVLEPVLCQHDQLCLLYAVLVLLAVPVEGVPERFLCSGCRHEVE